MCCYLEKRAHDLTSNHGSSACANLSTIRQFQSYLAETSCSNLATPACPHFQKKVERKLVVLSPCGGRSLPSGSGSQTGCKQGIRDHRLASMVENMQMCERLTPLVVLSTLHDGNNFLSFLLCICTVQTVGTVCLLHGAVLLTKKSQHLKVT
jgi:hypothetical protein